MEDSYKGILLSSFHSLLRLDWEVVFQLEAMDSFKIDGSATTPAIANNYQPMRLEVSMVLHNESIYLVEASLH